MGRMFVVLFAMVALVIAARDNKLFRIVLPLGVLGVGIIGGWVPVWIVVLLAIGAAFTLLQFARSKGATD